MLPCRPAIRAENCVLELTEVTQRNVTGILVRLVTLRSQHGLVTTLARNGALANIRQCIAVVAQVSKLASGFAV